MCRRSIAGNRKASGLAELQTSMVELGNFASGEFSGRNVKKEER